MEKEEIEQKEKEYSEMTDEELEKFKNDLFSGDPDEVVTVNELFTIFEWMNRLTRRK